MHFISQWEISSSQLCGYNLFSTSRDDNVVSKNCNLLTVFSHFDNIRGSQVLLDREFSDFSNVCIPVFQDWNLSNATGLSTADEPSSSGDESRTVDIMRGDTSVRKISTNGSLIRTDSPPSVTSLKIRPPTQLMGDTSPQNIVQDITATQWKHQPDVLVKGSCNYTAKVLTFILNPLLIF